MCIHLVSILVYIPVINWHAGTDTMHANNNDIHRKNYSNRNFDKQFDFDNNA